MSLKKAQEEEERLKALTPKEREEYKRSLTRLTGRLIVTQLPCQMLHLSFQAGSSSRKTKTLVRKTRLSSKRVPFQSTPVNMNEQERRKNKKKASPSVTAIEPQEYM